MRTVSRCSRSFSQLCHHIMSTVQAEPAASCSTVTVDALPALRMPAEWAPHTRCWMGWPERPDNWRNDGREAQRAFAAVARAVAQFEPVTVCVPSGQLAGARVALEGAPHVSIVSMEMDDAWFRDIGPTFVSQDPPSACGSTVAGVDWLFNAWGGHNGGCYDTWDRDVEVAGRVCAVCGPGGASVPVYKCPMAGSDGEMEAGASYPRRAAQVLEGGSIHVDGEGTLLTTEECLLNENRNPRLTREAIEEQLRKYLGVSKIIWLPRGLDGDVDTNGHVDNLACFARPGEVLLAWTDDPKDPQFEISQFEDVGVHVGSLPPTETPQEALAILHSQTDAKGRALKVHKLHIPPPLLITEEEASGVKLADGSMPRKAGDRLAASYVNFYLAGSKSFISPSGHMRAGLVMPAFDQPEADLFAKTILEAVFPDREVVAVPSREILLGGGNIHCITQQQPAPQG